MTAIATPPSGVAGAVMSTTMQRSRAIARELVQLPLHETLRFWTKAYAAFDELSDEEREQRKDEIAAVRRQMQILTALHRAACEIASLEAGV